MRLPQRSLRRAITPALVAFHAFALVSCESATNPMMVPAPSFGINLNEPLNVWHARELSLTAPDSSIAVGEQVLATAVPLSNHGGPMAYSPAISWSITPAEVATVSSDGRITGVAPGTAIVSATAVADNVTRTLTITVGAARTDTASGRPDSTTKPPSAAVHMVSISVNATTLKVGESTQISGVVSDVNGTPILDVPISWSTSSATVATVASSSPSAGQLTAQGVGTATIYAKADTVIRSVTLTVTGAATGTPAPTGPVPGGASGGSYGSATAAELPRLSVNTAYPSASRQVRVPAGADLQRAIDVAQPGDELLLAPGAVYSGNFYLRNKGMLNGWVTIRTDVSDASIGAPGTRMTPSRAASANLAKIVTPNIYSALTTDLGANHYRFTGVEIAVGSSVPAMNALVRLGESLPIQNSAAATASYLIFDRTYIHGNPSGQLKRCVMLNSATTAVIDSWLGECHSNEGDSQAIVGWNGPGPYLIENNHLEAGDEVILFGGGGVTVQNVSPSDITVRGNHIMRPTSWKGVWQAKNLVESKHARRLLIEGNVIENSWQDAQVGFAFVLKSENQDWDTPWTQTTDVTIRYNKIRNIGSVFNLAGNPSGAPAVAAGRFVISDNVVENVGTGMFGGDGRILQLLSGVSDIVMMHNTVVSAGGSNPAAIYFGGGSVSRLVVHSNVLPHGGAGVKGPSTTEGTASLNAFASGALYVNNAMFSGGDPKLYPANNWFPGELVDLGFVNLGSGDFRLSPTSGYANKGYDGRNIGADIDQVNALTRNAVVGP